MANQAIDNLAQLLSQDDRLLAAILNIRASTTGPQATSVTPGTNVQLSSPQVVGTSSQLATPGVSVSHPPAASLHFPSNTSVSHPAALLSNPQFPQPSVSPASFQPNASQASQSIVQSGSIIHTGQSVPAINPVLEPYQSLRTNRASGHPPTTVRSLSAMQQLLPSASLSTSAVNQQRLAHSAASGCIRRRRGGAAQSPSLVVKRPKTGVDLVRVEGTEDLIRVVAKVFPPLLTPSNDALLLHRTLHDTVDNFRTSHGLIYRYEHISLSETLTAFNRRVENEMSASPFKYQFRTASNSMTVMHEAQGLQALELVHRGIPRPKDNAVRLRRPLIPIGPGLTIGDLFSGNYQPSFAHKVFNYEDNYFVIYLVVRNAPLFAEVLGRKHTCLSNRFYTLFANDTSVANLDEVGYESSGDESDSDFEVENQLVTTHHQPTLVNTTHQQLTPPNTFTNTITDVFVPESIWSETWIPSEFSEGIYYGATLSAEIFERASTLEGPSLFLEGRNIAELADELEKMLEDCISRNDFRKILAVDRTFLIHDPITKESTSGNGVELEAIYYTFSRYTKNQARWFIELMDGRVAPRPMLSAATSHLVPQDRLLSMKKLGALSALMIISQRAPDPIDPAVFQFFFHQLNVHSLTRDFIGLWHPDLRKAIDTWHALSPADDPSNIVEIQSIFNSYIGKELPSVRVRDLPTHKALGAEMLYYSVLGPNSYSHPELQAVYEGFQLPCPNGFSFLEVGTHYFGGSEALLEHVYSSSITSPDTVISRIEFKFQSLDQACTSELRALTGNETLQFKDLFFSFLRGSGIPNRISLDNSKPFFDQVISLDNIDHPNFRSEMFAWAVSGSPTIDPNGNKFKVIFVTDNNFSLDGGQKSLFQEGTLGFKTCYKEVYIPTGYILGLGVELSCIIDGLSMFQKTIDNWLLCQLLGAIGHHSKDT